MHSDFRDKLSGSIRRPSLAGDGLPERMRSTVFAFLGLTAAAGLALVAIFAQLGFPLLSPTPLPERTGAELGLPGRPAGAWPPDRRDRAGRRALPRRPVLPPTGPLPGLPAAARGAPAVSTARRSPSRVRRPASIPARIRPRRPLRARPRLPRRPPTRRSANRPRRRSKLPASSPGIGEQPSKAKPVTAKPEHAGAGAGSDPKPPSKPPKTTSPTKPEATAGARALLRPAPAPTAGRQGQGEAEGQEGQVALRRGRTGF